MPRSALVLGSALSIWDDVEAALRLGEFAAVVACNDIGEAWPGRLDGWATVHPERLPRWTRRRLARGYEPARRVFATSDIKSCAVPRESSCPRFPGQARNGTSGLFAVKVALIDMGFDLAVCCGMPMERAGAHFHEPEKAWIFGETYREGWEQALPHIRDRVRSMGGWTKDLLGGPTRAWLKGS